MMAIHVLPDRDPDGGTSVGYLLAHGRSAAAFALLAGVGLALATARVRTAPEHAGVGAGIAVRGLAIGAIGLALGYPDSGVAVILPYYAMFFLLAVPLLRLRAGALAGLALVVAGVVPVVSHLLRGSLPPADTANPTFATLIQDPVRLVVELALTGYYPVLAWMTYLCAGLAVGRLPLRSTRVAVVLLGGGAALALAASSASWFLLDVLGGREQIAANLSFTDPGEVDRMLSESQYGVTPTTTWWWLSVASPHSSTPFDLLHTTGTALALLGAALLVARAAEWALVPLAAAGGMTLTLYTGHVLLLASPVLPADPTTSYLIQVAAVLMLATAWRAVVRRGPLEEAVAVLAVAARRAVTSRWRGSDLEHVEHP
ncbi:MAG: DUF1624 domain-containing protein [Streptosporangiales bacterium]|nr:DUF1624 domain-containing protein [Streptosporangiales bacterium]